MKNLVKQLYNHWGTTLFFLACLIALLVFAHPLNSVAVDGQELSQQPAHVIEAYYREYGSIAPQVWDQAHNIEIGVARVNRCPKPDGRLTTWDGRSLLGEHEDIQRLFFRVHGALAESIWVCEHEQVNPRPDPNLHFHGDSFGSHSHEHTDAHWHGTDPVPQSKPAAVAETNNPAPVVDNPPPAAIDVGQPVDPSIPLCPEHIQTYPAATKWHNHGTGCHSHSVGLHPHTTQTNPQITPAPTPTPTPKPAPVVDNPPPAAIDVGQPVDPSIPLCPEHIQTYPAATKWHNHGTGCHSHSVGLHPHTTQTNPQITPAPTPTPTPKPAPVVDNPPPITDAPRPNQGESHVDYMNRITVDCRGNPDAYKSKGWECIIDRFGAWHAHGPGGRAHRHVPDTDTQVPPDPDPVVPPDNPPTVPAIDDAPRQNTDESRADYFNRITVDCQGNPDAYKSKGWECIIDRFGPWHSHDGASAHRHTPETDTQVPSTPPDDTPPAPTVEDAPRQNTDESRADYLNRITVDCGSYETLYKSKGWECEGSNLGPWHSHDGIPAHRHFPENRDPDAVQGPCPSGWYIVAAFPPPSDGNILIQCTDKLGEKVRQSTVPLWNGWKTHVPDDMRNLIPTPVPTPTPTPTPRPDSNTPINPCGSDSWRLASIVSQEPNNRVRINCEDLDRPGTVRQMVVDNWDSNRPIIRPAPTPTPTPGL